MRSHTRGLLAVAVGLGLSSIAVALPWDTDMVDGQSVKAYEQPMRPLPEGVVSQPNLLTPRSFTPNYDRMKPEGQALASPFPATEATRATGAAMYGIYCTPCHGDGETLGPVAQPGRFPGVIALRGPSGIAPKRTDGYIYLTIRNGGAIMPYYGWAMTDEEMWSIVHYLRSQPGGAYIPPTPPPVAPEAQP